MITPQLGKSRFNTCMQVANRFCSIIEISECLDANVEVKPTDQRREALSDIAKPVRPNEFSLHVAFPFVGLFIALAIVLAVIFAKARVQGMCIT